jgi:UDP-GlcNAc:undecaprenyl-phosphate GlcNAc-1-phosphate transferase
MELSAFFLALGAFGVCALLHVAALRLFPTWGWLDFPERYGLRRPRLPYPTGILAVGTFLAFFLALEPWNSQTLGIAAGVALLAVISFIDDRRSISPFVRLGVQALAALIIFAFGTRIYSITNPFLPDGIIKLDTIIFRSALFADPPLWSGLFTFLWLGLTMNALNWFDGIPGQVSVLSVVGFLTIGFLASNITIEHADPLLQANLARLAFVLAGISLAGLLFDFPPNRVLMGDTGAMFLGLMLGVLTIYAGGKVATAFLVLGVPLIDSVIVILRRLAKGRSPFRGNATDEHLHHRLLRKGWSERRIILLTAGLGAAFGVTALFLSTFQKFIAALVLLLIMLGLEWYSRPERTR